MISRTVSSTEKPPSLFLTLLLSELYQLPVLLFSWLISSCFYMAVCLLSFLLCLSCLSINVSVLFCFLAPLPFLVLFLPLSEKVSTFPHRLQLGGQCPQKTNFSFLEISEMEFCLFVCLFSLQNIYGHSWWQRPAGIQTLQFKDCLLISTQKKDQGK